MSRRTHQDLTQRLFELAIKPKKWHETSSIVLPDTISPIKDEKLFRPQNHKRILELGAGWGEFGASYLRHNPDWDYIAFEIKPDRIKSIIKKTSKIEGTHVKIIPVNLNWFLAEILPINSWDLIVINFPDPWPKKRHFKHRLIQSGFAHKLRPLLRAQGNIWIATDYGPYARKILKEFRRSKEFKSAFIHADHQRERPPNFFPTKFERIQISQGKRPYYMHWVAI